MNLLLQCCSRPIVKQERQQEQAQQQPQESIVDVRKALMVTPVERRSSKADGKKFANGNKGLPVRRSLEFHDAQCGEDHESNMIFTNEELIQINTPDVDNNDDDDNDENYRTVLGDEKSFDENKINDRKNENIGNMDNGPHIHDDQDHNEGTKKNKAEVTSTKKDTGGNNTPAASTTLLKTPKPTIDFTGMISTLIC